MFPFDMQAARQRHEDMLREAEENRLARRLGEKTLIESLLSRMAQLLAGSRLPQQGQQDKAMTHPKPA
jgi:hypothetical protein